MTRQLLLTLAVLSCFCFGKKAWAQPGAMQPVQLPPDSVVVGFIPALSFNSDMGLILGGILNRYDYRGGRPPFRNFTSSLAAVSTRGLLAFQIKLDQVNTFGTPVRSLWELKTARLLQNFYFGLGNNSAFDKDEFEDGDLFFFQSLNAAFNYQGRYPIYRGGGITRLDVNFSASIRYFTPFDNATDRLLNIEQPLGTNGGFINKIGTGLTWENRDSEFRPTTGQFIQVNMQVAPTFLGSEFGSAYWQLNAINYFNFTLLRNVVVVTRAFIQHSEGDVPFFELPSLGGEETVRGYPKNRFLGNTALTYNLELRTWLLEFPKVNMRIGGQLFVDGGRVFDTYTVGETFENNKIAYGFGGALSLFNPDFFLRGDLGFSDETTRLFINVGYAF